MTTTEHRPCSRRRSLRVLSSDPRAFICVCVLHRPSKQRPNDDLHMNQLSSQRRHQRRFFSAAEKKAARPKLVSLAIAQVKQGFAGKWQISKGKLLWMHDKNGSHRGPDEY